MGATSALKRGDKGREAVEKSPDDAFIELVRSSMEEALRGAGELKEKNALFANCIKFIAVTQKLKGEEGSFFDD